MFIQLNKKGFTLVEIMIVVAIIGLLAAIAIPNLMRARLNANEGAVKSDLRAVSSAAESFRAAQTVTTYPATLNVLSSATPPYLDLSFVNGGTKHGYTFNLVGDVNGFGATAVPTNVGTSGVNAYCVDHTGVVRTHTSGVYAAAAAGCGTAVADAPIGG